MADTTGDRMFADYFDDSDGEHDPEVLLAIAMAFRRERDEARVALMQGENDPPSWDKGTWWF